MTSLQSFAEEVRTWMRANGPAALRGLPERPLEGCWGGRRAVFSRPEEEAWLHAMAARGWTAPCWPVDLGGAGLSAEQAAVIEQERRALGLPRPLVGFGLMMIGPILLEFGTPAQQARFLPDIAAGRVRWCQGYSEPGAGSDLASLRLGAIERDGALWLDGQKTWTSHAHLADWMFALVRTGKERRTGITFVLVDLTQPGITVRPIRLLNGDAVFCEVFFDQVEVPLDQVVGERGAGWQVATSLLVHERRHIAEIFAVKERAPGEGQSPVAALLEQASPLDPELWAALSALEMDGVATRLTLQRLERHERAGTPLPGAANVAKVLTTELNQARTELAARAWGPEALVYDGPHGIADATRAGSDWLRALGNTIEGGTTEVQLNLLASTVLGLPSAPPRERCGPERTEPWRRCLDPEGLGDAAAALLASWAPLAQRRAAPPAERTVQTPLWSALVAQGWLECFGPHQPLLPMLPVLAASGWQASPAPVVQLLEVVPLLAVLDPDALAQLLAGTRLTVLARTPEPLAGTGALVVRHVRALLGADSVVLLGADGALHLPVQSPVVTVQPLAAHDARPIAHLVVDRGALPPPGFVAPTLRSRHRGVVAEGAELLGTADRLMSLTLEHLRLRRQFGRPIGSFQALQHRMARHFLRLERARDAVATAFAAVDAGTPDWSVPLMAREVRTLLDGLGRDAVQLHGAIGITEEADVGLMFARARSGILALGSGHLARWRAMRVPG